MEWHIITGEYPPEWGGVSDYTYRIAQELGKVGDQVHVWSPAHCGDRVAPEMADLHALPHGFGWRWLRELDRGLRRFDGPRNILIQYVPHMYGWKSMNLSFCLWLCRQRQHNVLVMFHEVAFPFRSGQRLRHSLLAFVHRAMAWAILRRVRHSFTSTETYLALLERLGSRRSQEVSLLRICSNIPLESAAIERSRAAARGTPDRHFTVGIFSNFGSELRRVLEPALARLLENPRIEVLLLGPGQSLRQTIAERCPDAAGRILSTGQLRVAKIAGEVHRCDALLQLYPDGASAARGTLIAALGSGIPVVTTAGPLTDRLLLESRALLFPESTPGSIYAAIELLRTNPELAHELAARALRLYQESFHPAVIASSLRDVLRTSNAGIALTVEEPALQD